jgi:hypothetical protein
MAEIYNCDPLSEIYAYALVIYVCASNDTETGSTYFCS